MSSNDKFWSLEKIEPSSDRKWVVAWFKSEAGGTENHLMSAKDASAESVFTALQKLNNRAEEVVKATERVKQELKIHVPDAD